MAIPENSPIRAFLENQGGMVLDGGLATTLEAEGADLAGDLWSARLLLENPAAIRRVHLRFLVSGADCITSASYQGTVEGFMRRGLDREEAAGILRLSVELAREARDRFWAEAANRSGRIRPLVAASIGPYGASTADGAEYIGRYRLSRKELAVFHRGRWDILASAGADLLACETIPSAMEAELLAERLADSPGTWAWFSFSCRNRRELRDGTPLAEVLPVVSGLPGTVAVGINCTDPAHVASLVRICREITAKPVLAYPNSGEEWDPRRKRWLPGTGAPDLAAMAREWKEAGAALIGGCCRVGPEEIRKMRDALLPPDLPEPER